MASKKPKVTQKEIAEKAGVSIMTISNYLRRPEIVSGEISDRIEKAMETLGVSVVQKQGSPPKQNQSLVTHRPFYRIRLISCGVPNAWINDPFYTRIFNSLEQLSHQENFELLSTFLQNATTFKRDWISQVDGVLLFGNATQIHIPERIPAITLLSCTTNIPADNIDYDRGQVGSLAARYFLNKGVQHPLYITPGLDIRWDSLSETLLSQGITPNNLCIPQLYEIDSGTQKINESLLREKLVAFWQEHQETDGIFCFSDHIRFSVESILKELPLSAPPAIISVNNDRVWLDPLPHPSATIDVMLEEIAQLAFQRIIERIKDSSRAITHFKVQPVLIDGI